jgi:hypothetical protein
MRYSDSDIIELWLQSQASPSHDGLLPAGHQAMENGRRPAGCLRGPSRVLMLPLPSLEILGEAYANLGEMENSHQMTGSTGRCHDAVPIPRDQRRRGELVRVPKTEGWG